MKFIVALGALAVVIAGVSSNPLQNPAKKVVCYYGSWAVYRPGNGNFAVENIDPMICTHIIYGFVGISTDGLMRVLDDWNDLEENWGRGAMRRFTNLKQQNSNLKALLAIGGWNEGSINYSNMAQTQAGRRRFIDSVIPFLQQYNFDGFDLDWEYPTQRGGRPEDRVNFALLCQEMKAEFENHGLLLTAAVSAGEWTIAEAYDVVSISRSLDFINVMTYDMHGAWETYTGHHSPLFALPTETGNDTKLNVNNAIQFWMAQGAPAEKLILGMGSYGRGFILDDAANNGFYAPAAQGIVAGPYTREAGIWGYNEILEKFAEQPGQWTVVRNEYYSAPYAYNGRDWIGYDDVESIALKSRYARDLGLGGGMVWSLETDDFRGTHSQETYPLIRTMYRTLNGDSPPPTTTVSPITTQEPTGPTGGPTTTTQRTTTTTPPPSGECTAEGFFPHPTDCQRFYRCHWNGSSWETTQLMCGAGTIFDPVTSTCGWPDIVDRPECNDFNH